MPIIGGAPARVGMKVFSPEDRHTSIESIESSSLRFSDAHVPTNRERLVIEGTVDVWSLEKEKARNLFADTNNKRRKMMMAKRRVNP